MQPSTEKSTHNNLFVCFNDDDDDDDDYDNDCICVVCVRAVHALCIYIYIL